MKKVLKLVLILLILVILTITSFIILFSIGIMSSLIAGILLVALCFVLFCICIYGMVVGYLKFMGLRNRIEVVGLLTLSIFLALFIGLFTFVNALVEHASPNLDLEGKTRLVTSTFFQIPSQSGLLKEERNGIIYFFSPGNEETVTTFDTLLTEEKASFDNLFGNNDLAPLTIEIYDNPNTLNKNSLLDEIGGYYNKFNQSIHLLGRDPAWGQTLLHEYTHYRIQQLSKENDLASINRLPQWFEEGLSEVMGYRNSILQLVELEETVDFRLLDFNVDFHKTRKEDFDPYRQSYFAVQSLINDNGIEAIQELLLSETMDAFYENLAGITKKNLLGFQQSFLNDLLAAQKLTNEKFAVAYEAMKANNYEQAEAVLMEIKENGFEHDVSLANRELLNLFLDQNLFDEAIAQLEMLITNENYGYKTTDLIQLAEIYLLVDTKKALHTIELAKDEVPVDHWVEPRIGEYVEAYRLISSNDSVAGYKLLFDNELIFSDKVRNDLHEKLVREYPSEF